MATPLTTDEQTGALVRRIEEVEQEIARVREERARAGESTDRARIDELEARVREASRLLEAQRAVRPRAASDPPEVVIASVMRSTRISLCVLGGLFMAAGIFGVGMAIHLHAEWTMLGVTAAPGLIGLFLFSKAYYAKTLDDLDTGGL